MGHYVDIRDGLWGKKKLWNWTEKGEMGKYWGSIIIIIIIIIERTKNNNKNNYEKMKKKNNYKKNFNF